MTKEDGEPYVEKMRVLIEVTGDGGRHLVDFEETYQERWEWTTTIPYCVAGALRGLAPYVMCRSYAELAEIVLRFDMFGDAPMPHDFAEKTGDGWAAAAEKAEKHFQEAAWDLCQAWVNHDAARDKEAEERYRAVEKAHNAAEKSWPSNTRTGK